MTIKEAKEIVKRAGLSYARLDEVNYTTKPHIFKEIHRLSTANQFIEKMLLCMYNRQENDERTARLTVHKNYRGFNQADASTLSSLAEQFVEHHSLTPAQYNLVSHLLKKYHRQVFDIMQELGMIKIKGRLYYFDNEVYSEGQIAEKIDDTAIQLLDMVEEFNIEDFIHFAIEHAEETGPISDDDLPRAKQIAADLFSTGMSVQDAGNAINDQL